MNEYYFLPNRTYYIISNRIIIFFLYFLKKNKSYPKKDNKKKNSKNLKKYHKRKWEEYLEENLNIKEINLKQKKHIKESIPFKQQESIIDLNYYNIYINYELKDDKIDNTA